jgi:hypothetical protein
VVACLGEQEVASLPLVQLLAQRLLEFADPGMQRGLADVQLAGGVGEVAVLGEDRERLQVLGHQAIQNHHFKL